METKMYFLEDLDLIILGENSKELEQWVFSMLDYKFNDPAPISKHLFFWETEVKNALTFLPIPNSGQFTLIPLPEISIKDITG